MEMKFAMDVGSIKMVANDLKMKLELSKKEAASALKEGAQYIMAESTAEVPYQTGTLQSSAFINEAVVTNAGVFIKFGYGGPNDKLNPDTGRMASSYMVYVHEDLFKYHPYGKAKFLEDPVRKNELVVQEMLAGRLRQVFTKTVGR